MDRRDVIERGGAVVTLFRGTAVPPAPPRGAMAPALPQRGKTAVVRHRVAG